MTSLWTTTLDDGVLVASYSNAPMNYYTDQAVTELGSLVDEWQSADHRVIILTGGVPGKFVTHFDADEILAGVQNPRRVVDRGPLRNDAVNLVLTGLTRLRQPVIAALNGDTMGFGFELALACDLRIGQTGDLRYGLPEVRMGILPGSGGTQRLSRLIGLGAALDVVLRARVLPPEDALRVGLISELAPDALAAALTIAREICVLAPLPVALAKRALWQGFDAPLAAALTIESDASVRSKLGPDAAPTLAEYVALPLAERRDWLERR